MTRWLVLIVALVVAAEPAWAMQCTTETTYFHDGRVQFCQVCCSQYGGCTRQCY